MKKIISRFLVLFFCINLTAQENKKLFVGIYEKNKRGICGDYDFINMEVTTYAEYGTRRSQFKEAYKNSSALLVESHEAIIIFAYEKKMDGWNCKSDVRSYITAKSVEDCNKLLADKVAKSPKDFTTPPRVIFTWGKKKSTD